MSEPDPYALPDPLPERLPDETRSAYRIRVIPGWKERDRLTHSRSRMVKKWVRAALRDDPSLDGDDIRAVREEAREVWAEWHPENGQRLAHLRGCCPGALVR